MKQLQRKLTRKETRNSNLGHEPVSIPRPKKKDRIKKEIRTGELILKPKEDGTTRNKWVIAEKILSLVAKDFAADKVFRIVKLNKDVAGCIKKMEEAIRTYIYRFGALEHCYLNLVRVGADDAESQNFAVFLLKTLTAARKQFRASLELWKIKRNIEKKRIIAIYKCRQSAPGPY